MINDQHPFSVKLSLPSNPDIERVIVIIMPPLVIQVLPYPALLESRQIAAVYNSCFLDKTFIITSPAHGYFGTRQNQRPGGETMRWPPRQEIHVAVSTMAKHWRMRSIFTIRRRQQGDNAYPRQSFSPSSSPHGGFPRGRPVLQSERVIYFQ